MDRSILFPQNEESLSECKMIENGEFPYRSLVSNFPSENKLTFMFNFSSTASKRTSERKNSTSFDISVEA